MRPYAVFTGVVTCVTAPGAVGPGYDPTYTSLQGFIFGQFVIAALEAVAINLPGRYGRPGRVSGLGSVPPVRRHRVRRGDVRYPGLDL